MYLSHREKGAYWVLGGKEKRKTRGGRDEIYQFAQDFQIPLGHWRTGPPATPGPLGVAQTRTSASLPLCVPAMSQQPPVGDLLYFLPRDQIKICDLQLVKCDWTLTIIIHSRNVKLSTYWIIVLVLSAEDCSCGKTQTKSLNSQRVRFRGRQTEQANVKGQFRWWYCCEEDSSGPR